MSYTLRAALLTEVGKPLELEELEMTQLQYGQVFVRILVSGICGKQLGEISGSHDSTMPLPRPLGHEGCGIVEFIGPGVTKVKTGDKVILHWRKGDGIESDFPGYIRRATGSRITGGKVTTFMDWAIVSENRLTPVPQDTPDELCALLGCSLSTALGTIESEACVKFGESVLIIGCGGLGLNLILAAKLAQAGLIAVEDEVLSKEPIAFQSGALLFNHETAQGLPYGSHKYDTIIDTSGNEEAISCAMNRLGPSGRFVMVGQPCGDIRIKNARHLFDGSGCTIKATQGGRFNPSADVPRYIAMHRAGLLKLDGIVSHRVKLEEINEGLDLVRNGQAGRVLVEMI